LDAELPAMARIDSRLDTALPEIARLGARLDTELPGISKIEAGLDTALPQIPKLDARMDATLSHLATKADLADKPSKTCLWGALAVLLTPYASGLAVLAILK
jgi:hypothetical protein